MLLANGFKAAEVQPVLVFVSVVLAVGLGVIVALELVIDRVARRKRGRMSSSNAHTSVRLPFRSGVSLGSRQGC